MPTKTKKTKIKSKRLNSDSYIVHMWKGTEEQYNYLKKELEGFNEDSFKFVAHVLRTQLFRSRSKEEREEGIPIPYETIKHFLPELKKDEKAALVAKDIIIEVPINQYGSLYSKESGLCKEYLVNKNIEEQFANLAAQEDSIQYTKTIKVNIMNGKKSIKINKSQLNDDSRNPYPELIREAMQTIDECVFEYKPVDEHIQELRTERDLLAWTNGMDSPEYNKARKQFNNDLFIRNECLNQDAYEVFPGFIKFTPAYTVSSTGRIHTPMQNASKEMKRKAFNNVPNLRNYDLRSSQVIGLIQQFKQASLDTSWLENYKDNPQAKYDYADYVGIPVGIWKQCICALLMGGYVPTKALEQKDSKSDIRKYIYENCKDELESLEAYGRFIEIVAPLKTEINKWHNWLLEVFVPSIGSYTKGKLFIKNPTGITLIIDDLPKGKDMWQRKAKVAAFVLQGQEAAFIHHLTKLSKLDKYTFKVLQNEHDGLITLGDVPQDAVDEASRLSGLTPAYLELKPFK